MKYLSLMAAALIAGASTTQAATFTPADGLDLTRNSTQDANVVAYSEQSDVTVAGGAITVDFLVGANLNVGDSSGGVSTFTSGQALGAGTYNSYLVHFDPDGGGSADATFDFGETIVGLILSNAASNGGPQLLNLSDATFGAAGTTYDTHVGRRTESTDGFELLSATSLYVDLTTNSNHVDNIRVLTVAAVPVPASLPLLLAGFGGLAMLRRRR